MFSFFMIIWNANHFSIFDPNHFSSAVYYDFKMISMLRTTGFVFRDREIVSLFDQQAYTLLLSVQWSINNCIRLDLNISNFPSPEQGQERESYRLISQEIHKNYFSSSSQISTFSFWIFFNTYSKKITMDVDDNMINRIILGYPFLCFVVGKANFNLLILMLSWHRQEYGNIHHIISGIAQFHTEINKYPPLVIDEIFFNVFDHKRIFALILETALTFTGFLSPVHWHGLIRQDRSSSVWLSTSAYLRPGVLIARMPSSLQEAARDSRDSKHDVDVS